MNYCTKCGSKIGKNDKFCTNCGTKFITKQEQKLKEEKKNQNIILILGVFLVLFSSFALGIISWNNMNHIFRLLFFTFETLLFFGLSFVLKKVTDSKMYRLFFIIGLILVPYTLSLVAYYGLLSDYFNKGPGLFIYLSIIYFITFILYVFINKSFRSKFLNYVSLLSLLASFIFTALIFSESFVIITLLITVYYTAINLLSFSKLFDDDMKFVMKIFTITLFAVLFVLIIISISNVSSLLSNILNGISVLLYMVTGYLYFYLHKESIIKVFLPFAFSILSMYYVFDLLIDYEVIYLYVSAVVVLLEFFITILFNDKVFSHISLALTYTILLFLMLLSVIANYNLVFLVLSVITLIFDFYNILMAKMNWINYFIPFNIFIIIIAISKLTINLKFIYLLMITSFVYLIIYVILKIIKNKYNLTYLITTMVLSLISMYNFYYGFNITNYGIILIILLTFLLSNFFKENKAFSIISFVLLNISSMALFGNIDNGVFYGLLTISGSTLITCLLLYKFKNVELKPYILYSEIVIFLITLSNNMQFSSYILFINIFIFALSYMSVIKFYNKKWWRVAYILLGLLTVIRIVYTVIDPIVIASIISIAVIFIIITIMYLLEIEDNISLTFISLVILYPYYNLIGNTFADLTELYFIPAVIYDIVFTEVINFKNSENKKIFTIVPLSLISYFFIMSGEGVSAIIIDVVLALVYILLGLYRKYNYLIYFGVLFIIITVLVRLFTILDSIAVVIVLIVIGFILIGAVLINELRKKK